MHELTEEALVAASIDEVWRDFTRSSPLAEWFWPPRMQTTALVELRELGRWQVRSEPADLAVEATVLAVDAPRALRLEWRWAGEDAATDVGIALEPATDTATRVIVRQAGFTTADERERHVEGWADCLQRLVDRHGGAPGERLQ